MLFVLSGIRSIQISYAGIMQCFNVTASGAYYQMAVRAFI
jgi:hypothetical protein